jgi:hypothetical protein
MPRWLWFFIAGVVAIMGFVVAWLYVSPRIAAVDADMKRVPIPGSATVEFGKPGTYTIFLERQGGADRPSPVHASVQVFKPGTDTPIHLAKPSYESSYTIHERQGEAVLTFAVEQPGAYRVVTSLAAGSAASGVVVAIGLGTMGTMFETLGYGFAIVGAGLALAFAIAVLGARWRPKAKAE